MSGYRIRLARPDDVSSLGDIERRAAALLAAPDVPDLTSDVTPAAAFHEAASAGRLWIAAGHDDRPVGFALVEIIDGAAHLEELDVDPAHGRRGLGAALLATVCAWASAAGLPAVTLTTFADLPWNAPFYARHGFRALAASELTRALRGLLDQEAARGLPIARRVAMRWEPARG